jgi:hypothetical protein
MLTVVPHSECVFVGIKVVLVLPSQDGVFCPAIPRWPGGGAVETGTVSEYGI